MIYFHIFLSILGKSVEVFEICCSQMPSVLVEQKSREDRGHTSIDCGSVARLYTHSVPSLEVSCHQHTPVLERTVAGLCDANGCCSFHNGCDESRLVVAVALHAEKEDVTSGDWRCEETSACVVTIADVVPGNIEDENLIRA